MSILYCRKEIVLCLFLLTCTLLLASCNLSREPAEATIPVNEGTLAAETVAAQLTQAFEAATPTADKPTVTMIPFTQIPPQATIQVSKTPTAGTPGTSTPVPNATYLPTGPAAAATLPPLPNYKLRRQDDFSDEIGWHTEEQDNFVFQFKNGGYLITVNIPNAFIWSIWDRDFSDTRQEVEGSWDGGPQDGYYGLVCRHQDGQNYYGLTISSSGAYRILKNKEGTMEFLAEGMAPSGIIRGGETNRVTADCISETLSLYANGRLLAQVQDDDFDTGVVGLLAGTKLVTGFTARFDNYALFSP